MYTPPQRLSHRQRLSGITPRLKKQKQIQAYKAQIQAYATQAMVSKWAGKGEIRATLDHESEEQDSVAAAAADAAAAESERSQKESEHERRLRGEKQWSKLDVNGNGYIEGPELDSLAIWVYESCHAGKPPTQEQVKEEIDIVIEKLDSNGGIPLAYL